LAESIGSLYPTQIPSLSDSANIQAALRLYHYGDASYNINNTNPALLPANSIAGALSSLQTQITNVSGTLGVQASTWTGKGALVTATAASTVQVLTVSLPADDAKVLTVDSTTGTGLKWALPDVTLSNAVTLTNKTLTNPTINAGSGTIVLPGSNTPAQTVDGSIVWDLDSDLLTVGTGAGRKTMVDTDSTQTLTNKTLTSPTITSPTITNLYLSESGSSITFEGSTPDLFETTLNATEPTADNTISLPNVSGTVITTGNLTSITTVGTVTAGTWSAGTIAADRGGTGQTSYAIGDILYASGTTALSKLAGVATGNALISGGVATAPSWGKIGLTTHISGTLAVGNGGTGLTTVATGDIIYASASNTLAALAAVATGNALISGGVGVAPSYGKIGLTTHISGTLAIGNGGTNITTYATGDILYASAANTLSKLTIGGAGQVLTVSGGIPVWQNASAGFANPMTTLGDIIYGAASGSATRLAGTTSTTPSFLTSTGNGTNATAPVWTSSTGTGNVVLSASPALSGSPTAPTATAGTNTTQIATTAYAYQLEDFITIALSDEITNITTGTAKVTWRAPFAMTLTQIPRALLATASTSGNPTVDINEAGISILGANKLSIDANEKTSVTAATPTTLADSTLADDAEITFDIDVAGTGAKGLKVTLFYRRT
jgi:hypothetical protein